MITTSYLPHDLRAGSCMTKMIQWVTSEADFICRKEQMCINSVLQVPYFILIFYHYSYNFILLYTGHDNATKHVLLHMNL